MQAGVGCFCYVLDISHMLAIPFCLRLREASLLIWILWFFKIISGLRSICNEQVLGDPDFSSLPVAPDPSFSLLKLDKRKELTFIICLCRHRYPHPLHHTFAEGLSKVCAVCSFTVLTAWLIMSGRQPVPLWRQPMVDSDSSSYVTWDSLSSCL